MSLKIQNEQGGWDNYLGFSKPSPMAAGIILPFAGIYVPQGFLACDGSAVSRTEYDKLFAAIGTTWGAGDGSTTFNLPNLNGRTLIGKGSAYNVGTTGGEAQHTLTVDEMPSHRHDFDGQSGFASAEFLGYPGSAYANQPAVSKGAAYSSSGMIKVSYRGGGGAHNNMQPYATANYIISTGDTGMDVNAIMTGVQQSPLATQFGGTGMVADSIEDVLRVGKAYTLGIGTEIPSGADINSYLTPGKYVATSAAIANGLVNRPPDASSGSAAELIVSKVAANSVTQTFKLTWNGETWQRRIDSVSTTPGYGTWYCNSGIDSIVAEGETSGWHWVKYANGFATASKKLAISAISVSSPTGSLYMSSGAITESFPFTFAEAPKPNVNSIWYGPLWATVLQVSTTSIQMRLLYGASSQLSDVALSIDLNGRWK